MASRSFHSTTPVTEASAECGVRSAECCELDTAYWIAIVVSALLTASSVSSSSLHTPHSELSTWNPPGHRQPVIEVQDDVGVVGFAAAVLITDAQRDLVVHGVEVFHRDQAQA